MPRWMGRCAACELTGARQGALLTMHAQCRRTGATLSLTFQSEDSSFAHPLWLTPCGCACSKWCLTTPRTTRARPPSTAPTARASLRRRSWASRASYPVGAAVIVERLRCVQFAQLWVVRADAAGNPEPCARWAQTPAVDDHPQHV